MPAITLTMAQRALEAAEDAAIDRQLRVGIAVVDARGDLVALMRLDGAPWYSTLVARGKAAASAAFGIRSGDLTEKSATPAIQALMQQGDGIIPQRGAAPIQIGDEIVGAIGVSGARSEDDEEIAIAGVSAISSQRGGE